VCLLLLSSDKKSEVADEETNIHGVVTGCSYQSADDSFIVVEVELFNLVTCGFSSFNFGDECIRSIEDFD
jgi:hypothetical protein